MDIGAGKMGINIAPGYFSDVTLPGCKTPSASQEEKEAVLR